MEHQALKFLTHEYLHNYNVKAISPIELGPFEYDREVFTPMLWVSEGFTCYYESVLLERAGILTGQERLDPDKKLTLAPAHILPSIGKETDSI